MHIQRATPVPELLARLIFLVFPTACAAYFLIGNAGDYYGIIGDPRTGLLPWLPPVANMTLQLTLFFTTGMVASAIFHAFRFRFLPVFLLLAAGFYLIWQRLDNMAGGEFDAFFISVQFLVFSILFTTGWITGWGFVRWRYWAVLIAATVLSAAILLIAGTETKTVPLLLQSFIPALLYAVYLIFTSEQLYSYKDKSRNLWWFLSRRLLAFVLLAALLAGGVVWTMEQDIADTVAQYGGSGEAGTNSMLEKKEDGTFDLKDYSRLQGSLGRNNELLFCAHIDHFFPGTDIPNPLYLTAFHYTRFDTLTETFERDSLIPYNDLFEPDPSRIPLFFTETDSTVIYNSLGDQLREIVDVEIYSSSLSPATYLAPSTGFFVQPITVEKDFRDQFKTAFRTKSYVSALNSAYFIYNSPDETIQTFQQQRLAVLRKVKDYQGMDPEFMAYYTRMPADPKFERIGRLADSIAGSAATPVDKVIAIRDYFLSEDDNGEPLYTYTDNPGIPDIPSASKLLYFLFENHKGYCAYYAGATLFLLRALGIPSRITVGFLTVDRSDKNKGWYWYYADQAHAWVQVYFPGYGWLDFDTTVGNDDAEESPAPDGTPPMQPPRAWLAAEGVICAVDTLKKTASLQAQHLIFHDKAYHLQEPETFTMDMKIATVRLDSMEVPLGNILLGDSATAVSYAEAFKKMQPRNRESGSMLVRRFPDPAPVDEVFLKRKLPPQPEEPAVITVEEPPLGIRQMIQSSLLMAAVLCLLILLMPTLVFRYLLLRYHYAQQEKKAYHAWRAASFFLHQQGIFREELTPLQYAAQTVDRRFDTSFQAFMILYLKQKYAAQPLTTAELAKATSFLYPFLRKVRQQLRPTHRLKAFLNPLRTVTYFVSPGQNP